MAIGYRDRYPEVAFTIDSLDITPVSVIVKEGHTSLDSLTP